MSELARLRKAAMHHLRRPVARIATI